MKRTFEILKIAQEMQKKKFDSVFGVIGREGSGKTDFTLNCDDFLGATIANIAIDKDDVPITIRALGDDDVFHFDEAGDGLLSRDSLSKWNRELVKLFMICRAKRWITFLVLPDFFMLDSYFRKFRLAGLFYVYSRGRVMFYDRKAIEKICLYGEKTHQIKGARPLFYDTFPKYKGVLRKAYDLKKAAKVKKTIEAFDPSNTQGMTKKLQIIQMLIQGIKPPEIAKKLLTPLRYVYEIQAEQKKEVFG